MSSFKNIDGILIAGIGMPIFEVGNQPVQNQVNS
jgi:hypothetical protein